MEAIINNFTGTPVITTSNVEETVECAKKYPNCVILQTSNEDNKRFILEAFNSLSKDTYVNFGK